MLQPKPNSDAQRVWQLLWEGARVGLSLPCRQPNLSSHAQGIQDASDQASMVGQKESMNQGGDGAKSLGME